MHTRRVRIPESRRCLTATAVFDSYWRFAVERQRIFHARVRGVPPPWTEDRVLTEHRFTNAYRASDRVSQYLIRNVIYAEDDYDIEDTIFRILLFKIFNRIDTWEELGLRVGAVSWRTFDYQRYRDALSSIMASRQPVYSAAYIMPCPKMGATSKHDNHLLLLADLFRRGLARRLLDAGSLEELYQSLLACESFGPFLAFQYAIDLNYSPLFEFSEMDFVVAGPGARSGMSKCFVDTAGLRPDEVIRAVTELAASEFARQALSFDDLWGRPLQLIDCQNLFCEVDKYARVVHPEVQASTSRTRIKQRFRATSLQVPQWYPPKWNLVVRREPVTEANPNLDLREDTQLSLFSPHAATQP
jgi:hypothetical protein